jgi:hypothetical protein
MTAKQTVYLHIGLHKTGTTYLQRLFGANRDILRDAGIDYPGGPTGPSQLLATYDLQGRRPYGYKDPRVSGQWAALVEAIATGGQPRVLMSEERLSLCSRRQVRRAVEAFPDADVQVIITVRDLARVLVSQWQQNVKSGATWTWQQFVDSVGDPDRRATNPARSFWLRHDVGAICARWAAVVSAQHVHVVTVPRSGSSPQELVSRVGSVVGFAADDLRRHPTWANESVGVAGTEVIRRLNHRLGDALNQAQRDRVINSDLVPALARGEHAVRFGLPEEQIGWVTEHAEATIKLLRDGGYDIVGDLDELRVAPEPGMRRPDETTDAELLDAALDGLALLTEQHARVWWQRRRQKIEAQTPRRSGDLAGRGRRASFYLQAKAAGLADRNKLAAKALDKVVRTRDRHGSD